MKSIKTLIATAALAISAIVVHAAPTTNIQTFNVVISSGYHGQLVTCTNTTFYGQVFMTNNTGLPWLTPPPGTTTGTFSDISGYPTDYHSYQIVKRKIDSFYWKSCDGVTFPATNSSYELANYITEPYPTNATLMTITLQVVWQ